MGKYEELIEGLIRIKDGYAMLLTDVDIINDTCNLLEKLQREERNSDD